MIHLSIKEAFTKQPDGRIGRVGIFCPAYKYSQEIYAEILRILGPHATGNQLLRQICIKSTGGIIEFWTLGDPRAGRSRSYSLVFIDEAAFAPYDGSSDSNTMSAIWERSIMPTLLDRVGSRAYVLSTPNVKSGFFITLRTIKNGHVFMRPLNQIRIFRKLN